MRVFGSPAQIFLKPTVRNDLKLSDRSISGTFVGISDKGNGYIFLVRKSNTFVEIESKDAKFNETFAEHRERQGQLTTAPNIEPDLREEHNYDTNKYKDNTSDESSDDDVEEINTKHANQQEKPGKDDDADGEQQRQRRRHAPRQFLLPGSHATKSDVKLTRKNIMSKDEKEMLKNLCKATDKWEAAIAMQPFSDSEIENRKQQTDDREIRIR